MRLSGWVLIAAAATASSCACTDEEPVVDAVPPAECTDLTYQNFAQGFIHTWCLPCHTRTVDVDRRQCALAGVNFDTYDEVRIFSVEIDRKVSGVVGGPPPDDEVCNGVPTAPDCLCAEQSDMRMPPAGGVSEQDAALLHEWVSCGAPGEPVEPPACFTEVPSAGAVALASQADADAFCSGGTNHVGGDLVISASVDVACLCGVEGSLSITGAAGDVSLPLLDEVGSLSVVAVPTLTRLSAPNLRTAGIGDVTVASTPTLATLDLSWLEDVTGSVAFSDLDGLTDLAVGHLANVGGELRIEGIGAVTADLTRIRTVGGDVVVVDNSLLVSIDSMKSVDTIGGDLVITGNALLEGLDIADVLLTLGGDVVVSDNPSLASFGGFTLLPSAQAVTLSRNDALESIEGFDSVLLADAITVADHANLLAIVGFANLATLTDAAIYRDNPRLTFASLPLLTTVGDLTIEGNALSLTLAFPSLVTVEGALVISDNTDLTTLAGFAGLDAVGGALTITDNPELPTAVADALVEQVGIGNIGGTVTITGNAP